jgi:multiple sugar transport system permease protein
MKRPKRRGKKRGVRFMFNIRVLKGQAASEKTEFFRIKGIHFGVSALRLIFILGLCYLFLFPVFYMISTALQTAESANDPSVIWLPKALSLETLKTTLEILKYPQSTLLTAMITLGGTLGSVVSCGMAGYGFARFKFAERKLLFLIVILMIIVPPQTTLMSSYVGFRFFDFGGLLKPFGVQINLLNTPWVFILPSFFASGLRAGLFIFIFRQFFAGLPKDLEEAARVDGSGFLRTFIRIMAPLAIPAIITVTLFSFIWHWNDYYSSAMYFNQEVRPISVMLSELENLLKNAQIMERSMSPYQVRMYMQAGALLTILPPFALYIVLQKYFTESIERSGIVG